MDDEELEAYPRKHTLNGAMRDLHEKSVLLGHAIARDMRGFWTHLVMGFHRQHAAPKEAYDATTSSEFVDESTTVRMIVDSYNPEYPGHPKITVIVSDGRLSLEEINVALSRLRSRAGIPDEDF